VKLQCEFEPKWREIKCVIYEGEKGKYIYIYILLNEKKTKKDK
jgi:hypothetical protein